MGKVIRIVYKPAGIVTALVTPFRADNEDIDFKLLKSIIDFQCDCGIDGIFVSGSTAEAYAMEPEEKRELLQATVEYVAGRSAVYFGAGGSSTRQTCALVRMAEEEKADAVSVINPYFVVPSQNELVSYYTDVANSTSLPIVLYNHPLRTQVNISGDTVGKLSRIKNIVGIKDSSANVNNAMDYLAKMAPDFRVMSGNDSLIVTLLDLDGAGAVSASANFVPKLVKNIYTTYKNGHRREAIRLQKLLFNIRKVFTLGTYPVMIKEACRLMGMDMGVCRKPLAGLNQQDLQTLRQALSAAGEFGNGDISQSRKG